MMRMRGTKNVSCVFWPFFARDDLRGLQESSLRLDLWVEDEGGEMSGKENREDLSFICKSKAALLHYRRLPLQLFFALKGFFEKESHHLMTVTLIELRAQKSLYS